MCIVVVGGGDALSAGDDDVYNKMYVMMIMTTLQI